MTTSSTQNASIASEDRRQHNESARQGVLLISALLASVIAIAGGIWATQTGSAALAALTLESILAVIGCGLTASACRLRRWLAQLHETADQVPSSDAAAARLFRWGDADNEDVKDALLSDLEHRRSLHYLFIGILPTAIVALAAVYQLYRQANWVSSVESVGQAAAIGLLCLGATCVWLVLVRIVSTIPEQDLPEASFLTCAFREIQCACVVVALAVLGSLVWAPAETAIGKLLSVWVLAVSIEQIVKMLPLVAGRRHDAEPFAATPRLILRETVLMHGNPLRSLNRAIESRLGVSLRASWALRFTRSALVPAIILVALLQWGLSALCVVQLDHLGVRESFGQVDGAALGPGLHWKLPWPFGRMRQYPAKNVSTTYVGFIRDADRQPAYLWSKKHAQQEFALVLGNGSELVAVGCMVYYKIGEDRDQVLKYAYQFQNPDEALEAYAYRALMEQTRSATLAEILSTNRAQFADELERSLRQYCADNRLGIEVVEVALIGLHPPVEVAADYLDVISAWVDAERAQTEAKGQQLVTLQDAERERNTAIAEARVEAAKRVGAALGESSEFLAIGSAYQVAPDAFKLRLWFETLEEILQQKRFVLIDKNIRGDTGGILLDQRDHADVNEPVSVSPAANR